MVELTVKEAARRTRGQLFSKNPKTVIQGFSIDSRTIKKGQFFIAVEGKKFNGHDFIREAVENGAAGLIVRSGAEGPFDEVAEHVIRVDDTIEAMGRIAAGIRRRVSLPVVCVTGTNGKTTTKDILAHILSSKFRVLKSERSFNNTIGLSLTLFGLDDSYDVAVLELGTNHPGEISKLAAIASPYMAVITNVGDGHLENFADREGVFLEKISLLDQLPDTGIAFLNRDDTLLARTSARQVMKKFFGTAPGSDFLIGGMEPKERGYEFTLNGRPFSVPLEGEHNVFNAAAAMAVSEYFGLSWEEIQKALEGISLPEMRLERKSVDGLVFINDAYNANPDSFECALKVLQRTEGAGMKVVVAGDMLELGEMSEEFHRMIGRSIADKGIDLLVTLGGRAGRIAEGALESGMDPERVFSAENCDAAAGILKHKASRGAVVLLKASREIGIEEVLKCFSTSCIR